MVDSPPPQRPWFFDADGWTRYPLYHGTSTYFTDSIQAHGLGGRDIVREWRAVEMYRELCLLLSWQKPVAYNRGGAWGYGETYLTAYASIARRDEPELFGLIRADLSRLSRSARDKLLGLFPEIAACLTSQHRPVLLLLPRLHKSNLLGWISDAPGDSMGELNIFELALKVPGFQSPEPTFRLRGATDEFEIIR
jgi:hypothetical protein